MKPNGNNQNNNIDNTPDLKDSREIEKDVIRFTPEIAIPEAAAPIVIPQPSVPVPDATKPVTPGSVTPLAPMPAALHPIPNTQIPVNQPAAASSADSAQPVSPQPQAPQLQAPQPQAQHPAQPQHPQAQHPHPARQTAAKPASGVPDITQYPDNPEWSDEQKRMLEMAKTKKPRKGDKAHKSKKTPDFDHLAPPKKNPGKIVLTILLSLLLAGAAGLGGWYFWSVRFATFDYQLQPVVILDGQTVDANDFLPDSEITKGVTAVFKDPAFMPVPGRVVVPLTLKLGLRTIEVNATLYVLVPVDVMVHEYKSSSEYLTPDDLITNASLARGIPFDLTFTQSPLPLDTYSVGPHTLGLSLNGVSFEVILQVEDTTPPQAKPQPVLIEVGEEIYPEAFISEAFDHSGIESIAFTGNLAGETVIMALQDIPSVEILITDREGNSETYASSLSVIRNQMPPSFINIPLVIESMVDNPVNYPLDIAAFDDFGRDIGFEIIEADLNINEIGIYTVTFRADDFSGYKTEVDVEVHIIGIDPDEVDFWVDAKLAEILTGSMTQDEKVRAIFNEVRRQMSPSSDLSTEWTGSVYTAAHHAITSNRGMYYHYYALSEIMLTRAGIVNTRIERSPSSRAGTAHMWNLVYYDGDGWYHYDSYPITNWISHEWINRTQHKFTQAQAAEMAETLAEASFFRKEGFYDYIEAFYPDVVEGEEEEED